MPTEKRLRKREGRQARLEEMARVKRQQQARRRGILIGIGVVVVIGLAYLLSRNSGHKGTNVAAGTTTTTVAKTTTTLGAPAGVGCPKLDGSSPHYQHFTAAPPTCIDATKTYTVTFQTDVGTFVAVLDPKEAPKTVNNFVFLTGYHYFDGIVFHRVVPDFVIQGGDPTGTGSGGPGYQFADELPKAGQYKIGSLAMANSGPNTNGSQFFVITGSQGVALQPNYSLFGMVTSGIDIVHKIEADGAQDPNPPKVIHKMIKVTVTET